MDNHSMVSRQLASLINQVFSLDKRQIQDRLKKIHLEAIAQEETIEQLTRREIEYLTRLHNETEDVEIPF